MRAAGATAEDFLRSFHSAAPGLQSMMAAAERVPDGSTGPRVPAKIDLSAAELELVRRRPALATAELREGRAQQLPFADGVFDAEG
ncbi:hypothetical protein [Kitasatospora sp. NPDC088134]|uniref:hypothetical protein n=1 Tax=Kitasatospora sp. NPDC088134 TaxID=3364071 RepID=UPI003802F69F